MPERYARLGIRDALTAALLCLGISLLAYPSASSWVAAHNHANIVLDQAKTDAARSSAEVAAIVDEAHAYNEMLRLRAASAFDGHAAEPNGGQQGAEPDYWQMLAPGQSGIIARLRIPAIAMDLPVYHGTSSATLLKGAGHLQGTALPVGGLGSHAVLTGHRGLARAEMFSRLDEVAMADSVVLEVLGETMNYRVSRVQVVGAAANEEIRPVQGRDLVTLVTCTPLGVNSHRILVTAEREELGARGTVASAKHSPAGPGFPWWVAWWGGGLGATGCWLWCGVIGSDHRWCRSRGGPAGSIKAEAKPLV